MAYDFSEAANLTNQQLAEELAKLTPMTVNEINELLPRKADKQRLQDLIGIVGGATSENKKVASLTENMSAVGGVVVRLLGKYLRLV